MLTVRPFRTEELPEIIRRSAQTAWTQLMQRDLDGVDMVRVAGQVQQMYRAALGMPRTQLLVGDWPGVTGPAAFILLMPQASNFTGVLELIVLDIYTSPSIRGKGVGRQLMDRARQYGQSIGSTALIAPVALPNAASLKLMQASGLQAERVVMGGPC
jgi:L-amino acid N-acyltransferase YncA